MGFSMRIRQGVMSCVWRRGGAIPHTYDRRSKLKLPSNTVCGPKYRVVWRKKYVCHYTIISAKYQVCTFYSTYFSYGFFFFFFPFAA